MEPLLPNREVARQNGWSYQVQWVEDGNTCFVRCKTGPQADSWADRLRAEGREPAVFDLHDLLQLH